MYSLSKEKVEKVDNFFDELNEENVLFSFLRGSHSYGTQSETSDIDLTLLTLPSLEEVLQNTIEQKTIRNKQIIKGGVDANIMPLPNFLRQLLKGNPFCIELLYSEPPVVNGSAPKDIVQLANVFYSYLNKNRHNFITKSTVKGWAGMATSIGAFGIVKDRKEYIHMARIREYLVRLRVPNGEFSIKFDASSVPNGEFLKTDRLVADIRMLEKELLNTSLPDELDLDIKKKIMWFYTLFFL